MNVDKLIEGAEKIINMVCKYVNQRTTEIEENVRQKLRERSDAEIKKHISIRTTSMIAQGNLLKKRPDGGDSID